MRWRRNIRVKNLPILNLRRISVSKGQFHLHHSSSEFPDMYFHFTDRTDTDFLLDTSLLRSGSIFLLTEQNRRKSSKRRDFSATDQNLTCWLTFRMFKTQIQDLLRFRQSQRNPLNSAENSYASPWYRNATRPWVCGRYPAVWVYSVSPVNVSRPIEPTILPNPD
jgi:hypothetical protein